VRGSMSYDGKYAFPPWIMPEEPPRWHRGNPFHPISAAQQIAANEWFKRTLFQTNEQLYRELFSFARIRRAETRSPLLLELAVFIGILGLPGVIVTGIMRAAAAADRVDAETRIRQAEANSKEQEAAQRGIQTEIFGYIRDAVRDHALSGTFEVPDSVLQAAATIASPSVADLSNSALIEKITFGIEKK